MKIYNDVSQKIFLKIKEYEQITCGFSQVDCSFYIEDFKCAIILITPHIEKLTLDNYYENKFKEILEATKAQSQKTVSDLTEFLDSNNIKYAVPPAKQRNEESLEAVISYKFEAVKAGLGWIGKNGVLVTKEHRPRVRIDAVLVDAELPLSKPVEISECDVECNKCISACPCDALKGKQWDIRTFRENLIDYKRCNTYRSRFLEEHNRKDSCGLCIAACPIGH